MSLRIAPTLADAIQNHVRSALSCAICAEDIPPDAPRSVGEDDTVWCAGCYEDGDPNGAHPPPTVPKTKRNQDNP